MKRERELELEIRLVCTRLPGTRFEDACEDPPSVLEPVHLGIQKGKDVIEAVPADRRQATFEASLRVKRLPDGSTDFLGPFAQGKRGERFLYLSWGVPGCDGEFGMFRRAKIHLSHLEWREVSKAIAAGKPIVARLDLTDAKGGPLCASVKEPYIRWES